MHIYKIRLGTNIWDEVGIECIEKTEICLMFLLSCVAF